MNDLAFISDLHFCRSNANKLYFESDIEFFEKQFFPYLKTNQITSVFCLGDIFDERVKIDIYILQELKSRFFKWFEDNKVHFHICSGNHDLVLKNDNSYSIFNSILGEHTYVNYYINPTTINTKLYKICMLPWITGNIKEVKLPECDILLMHSDLKGFRFTKGIECKDGFDPDMFKKYKIVMNGHMHIQDHKANVWNIGNPFQKDFGDFGESKGFWTLGDNYNLTFHENIISPKHLKIIYTDTEIYVVGE